MNAITPAPERDDWRGEAARSLPEWAKALPSHIAPERFHRVVLTAIQSNPDLLEADRRSLWAACMKCAQAGLLPDGREAALITFYDRRAGRLLAQYMPMIAGILKLVRNSGELATITAEVVYEGEHFRVVLGDEDRIEHNRDLDAIGARPVIAAYAIATLRGPDGQILRLPDGRPVRVREVMTKQQIEDVRAISRAPDKGPWGKWWEEMARKSVLRRLAKRLPMSSDQEGDRRLRSAIEAVDEQYAFDQRSDDPPPDAQPPPEPERIIPWVYVSETQGRTIACPDQATWAKEWQVRISSVREADQSPEYRIATLRGMWRNNRDALAVLREAGQEDAVEEIERRLREASRLIRAEADGADLPSGPDDDDAAR